MASVLLRSVIVFLAYYGAARLGVLLALPHTNITPVWPPSGIAVAALVLLGWRYWPVLFASAFLVEATTGLPVPVAAGLAAGNTVEYVLAAVLLGRAGFSPRMDSIRDMAWLGTIGAVLCPLVAATIGTASLWAGGIVSREGLHSVWSIYLLGDGVGILVFAPFIFAWSPKPRTAPSRAVLVEVVILALAVAGLSVAVFLLGLRLAYVIFPFAIVAAVRFGQRGATATTLLVAIVAVLGVTHGLGPMEGTPIERLGYLQVYLAAFGLTAMSLAAASSAQKNAERITLEHAARLEDSNRELEAFAYTVAHDLRAPLRAIDGYSKAIIEDYGESLPADATRSLNKIGSNAIAMGRMIDALLQFSRLGSKRIDRTWLRPAAIAQQVYERLRLGRPEREMRMTIGEAPPCLADPVLLGLVYQNLIGNALKFSRNGDAVQVDIGWLPATDDPSRPVFYVRDNGIGFDMKYADKIFGVFQRLHRESEYPGTGAGLAIVKRIVDKHGGAVWAQAEKDRGATFFFTLGGSGAES